MSFSKRFKNKSPFRQQDPPTTTKEQVKNWVQTRKNTGRFEDQLSDEQLKRGLTNLDKVKKVSKKEYENVLGEDLSWSQGGGYGPDDQVYFANNPETESHELAHVFDIGTTGATEKASSTGKYISEDDIKSSIQDKITSIPIKPYTPNFFEKTFGGQKEEQYSLDEYALNAREVFAELMRFRLKHDIDPKKVFTTKDLPELRRKLKQEEEYGSDRNIDQHYSDKNLLRLFNEVVDVNKINKNNSRFA